MSQAAMTAIATPTKMPLRRRRTLHWLHDTSISNVLDRPDAKAHFQSPTLTATLLLKTYPLVEETPTSPRTSLQIPFYEHADPMSPPCHNQNTSLLMKKPEDTHILTTNNPTILTGAHPAPHLHSPSTAQLNPPSLPRRLHKCNNNSITMTIGGPPCHLAQAISLCNTVCGGKRRLVQ